MNKVLIWIFKRRRLVLLTIYALVVVFAELYHHYHGHPFYMDYHLAIDIALYGFILPISFAFVILYVERNADRVEKTIQDLSLQNIGLQNRAREQEKALDQYRKRVARELHNTLGQNLAYIRMKIDSLSEENPLQSIDDLRYELEKMRETADEAYEQVRSTLDSLHQISTEDFLHALLAQAKSIGNRSNIEVRINSEGQSAPIPPTLQQQLLLVCREVFNNIEKHARARLIHIQLTWNLENLTIPITDDGVGFTPVKMPPTNLTMEHYGLEMMDEQMKELGGQLTINSKPGAGTQVILWAPLLLQPAPASS